MVVLPAELAVMPLLMSPTRIVPLLTISMPSRLVATMPCDRRGDPNAITRLDRPHVDGAVVLDADCAAVIDP